MEPDRIAERLLLHPPEEAPLPVGQWESADYSPLVREHFQRPRNVGGHLPGPGIIQTRSGSRAVGAEVALSFDVSNGRVTGLRFQAFGCPHFLAAASLATERLRGLAVATLADWRVRDLGELLGVPVEKRGRLLILEDAVRAAALSPTP